ncbi:MAG: hypothetical protein COC15_04205 [Legionellales bacterium]|nr:MAG: hypothetical protein COC15_04205 [Legionellales bacterium]
MGRKYNLIKETNGILKSCRFGAYTSRCDRKNIMRILINDLVSLKIAPISIRAINQTHVFALVKYWQKHKLAYRTIRNKLGVLRTCLKIAQSKVVILNNKQLGICNTIKQKSYALPDNIEKHPDMVIYPVTKSIIEFQLYFGLTKTESVCIDLNLATHETGTLTIYRDLATNNKDIIVPIVTTKQQQSIATREQLLTHHARLTDIISKKNLLGLYRANLLFHGLNPSFPYRKYYAKNRLASLLQDVEKKEALYNLQCELGIQSKRQLQELL